MILEVKVSGTDVESTPYVRVFKHDDYENSFMVEHLFGENPPTWYFLVDVDKGDVVMVSIVALDVIKHFYFQISRFIETGPRCVSSEDLDWEVSVEEPLGLRDSFDEENVADYLRRIKQFANSPLRLNEKEDTANLIDWLMTDPTFMAISIAKMIASWSES